MRPKALMRVVGGEAKGRRLKGTIAPGARPTTERVRAAIFNILDLYSYRDKKALDLFAGSGSLGIEALSQGAAWADFVERDRKQCEIIRSNLENTGFSQHSKVYQADATRVLETLNGPYQLILLDPPYALENIGEVLEKIASAPGLVDDQGIVVVGHSRHLELLPHYGSLLLESHRRYGDNVVEFYAKR
ncbi:MAG: 16S rRNA (guanine(966)-N(2))-methyltransferase RsmD [Chloroflexi bacterium]|nr:16S rRNA (guanine(966)-N(2))-methyltransferase RsmD [Chloroflexota bacterium]MDA1218053.1 16S rRNA (guanine(966)-N(2))-methyltransferase RsmD [Chloroflexota bacterium]